MSVWAHHMFVTGQVLLPFFSFLSFLIAVPTGMKFFVWIGTMWRGQISFETPMMFAIGFLVTFLFGGLSGVLLAAPPIDFHVSDSYFVIAHFHYVLFGTIVFAVFAGIYFWFPKMFGRMLDDRLGKIHFWLTFLGFHATFLVQHWLGTEGMPRRYADYLPSDGFTFLNTFSTLGSFVLGASTLPFIYNVWKSYKVGQLVTVDDPWGHGNSLEWATSSPPPLRNFDRMPRIRSERPAFDAKFPELAAGRVDRRPAGGRRQAADRRVGRRRHLPGRQVQRNEVAPRPRTARPPAGRSRSWTRGGLYRPDVAFVAHRKSKICQPRDGGSRPGRPACGTRVRSIGGPGPRPGDR